MFREFTARLFFLGATTALVNAATLSMPNESASAGETVIVPVKLSSTNAPISGLQFDMTWDSSLDVHAAASAQIGLSNMALYSSFPAPPVTRFLVVGIDNNRSIEGELMRLFITVNPSAPPGVAHVTLKNLFATNSNGAQVAFDATPITVQILSAAPSNSYLIQPTEILNAGSFVASSVSPGEIVTLFASISDPFPQVLVNNIAAPILYAGTSQINAIVPFGLQLGNAAQLVIQQGTSIASTTIPVAAAAPSIFTLNATGTGPGAILNQDYSVNTPSHAAAAGSALMIYGTGFGMLNPLPIDGQAAQDLAITASPVTATIEGVPAQVIYAGAAPGLMSGVVQINVLVPNGLRPNPAAPISLSIGSFTTQPGVTVSIQ